jgi:hypothetical protein
LFTDSTDRLLNFLVSLVLHPSLSTTQSMMRRTMLRLWWTFTIPHAA